MAEWVTGVKSLSGTLDSITLVCVAALSQLAVIQ